MTARKVFSARDVRLIEASPAATSVSETGRISYTTAFRLHLLARLRAGDSATEVFAAAGLPSSLVGPKRIERAAANARRSERLARLLDERGDTWDSMAARRGASDDDLMRVVIAVSNRCSGLQERLDHMERLVAALTSSVDLGRAS